ncbi:HAD-like domain-containing protein [Schizophyllum amplum]|uniref:HAD-like domain-containing protein n=1 Tax=Schizophyllum amplum TaxID=97359 RepID=A0A550BXP2_9AGAR|nr:HAD-like domain-containing protein [Auriculariopsis ampla]
MIPTKIDALIFDLGDVLFTWNAPTTTVVPPKTLHAILHTPTWFDYERGRLTEDEIYRKAASEFDLSAQDVAVAFQGARDSLCSRPFMVNLIRDLKRDGRKVYAMSNISAPDWAVLRTKSADWDIFDAVFTSAEAGERKPSLAFFRHVIARTGVDPTRTVFVDDKFDNVLAARSFGMKGVVYDEFSSVERVLRNVCGDPVARGFTFMHEHAGRHVSFTSTGHEIQENFAQLLILEALGDPTLVDYTKYDGPFNFFRGDGQLTTRSFPFDVDTTSIGMTVARDISEATKHRVMDEMLHLRSSDGVLQVYFDPSRPRVDPVVCVNALCFFHLNGRGQELAETLDWVEAVLRHRAYLHGTRYYEPAEAFLYFLGRLLSVSDEVRQRLGALYEERCRERVNMPGDALTLAMRVISCQTSGVDAAGDVDRLSEMQQVDGGWENGWFYKYGKNGVLIANRGFTTALAINAIRASKIKVESKISHFITAGRSPLYRTREHAHNSI